MPVFLVRLRLFFILRHLFVLSCCVCLSGCACFFFFLPRNKQLVEGGPKGLHFDVGVECMLTCGLGVLRGFLSFHLRFDKLVHGVLYGLCMRFPAMGNPTSFLHFFVDDEEGMPEHSVFSVLTPANNQVCNPCRTGPEQSSVAAVVLPD